MPPWPRATRLRLRARTSLSGWPPQPAAATPTRSSGSSPVSSSRPCPRAEGPTCTRRSAGPTRPPVDQTRRSRCSSAASLKWPRTRRRTCRASPLHDLPQLRTHRSRRPRPGAERARQRARPGRDDDRRLLARPALLVTRAPGRPAGATGGRARLRPSRDRAPGRHRRHAPSRPRAPALRKHPSLAEPRGGRRPALRPGGAALRPAPGARGRGEPLHRPVPASRAARRRRRGRPPSESGTRGSRRRVPPRAAARHSGRWPKGSRSPARRTRHTSPSARRPRCWRKQGHRRDYVEAYRAWGKFLRRSGREEEALEVLERAADLAAEPVAADRRGQR